jgi:SWI/SNF-related matrix-associated actin-dependent regulator 1 of chromatin subfamily A
MQIIYDPLKSYKFSFIFQFSGEVIEKCRIIMNQFGKGKFTFLNGRWRFTDSAIINAISLEFPEVIVDAETNKAIIDQQIKEINEAKKEKLIFEIKNKKTTDFKVNGLKGEPFPYQAIGIEFMIASGGKCILADTQGLGKSLQALGYIAHTKQKKTLIICPASVKVSWSLEINKWTNLKHVVLSGKDNIDAEMINKNDIFVVNYDVMKLFVDTRIVEIFNKKKMKKEKRKVFELKPLFNLFKFDCVVCDEYQKIKNSTASRTKMVQTLVKDSKSILLLSGTPLMNRTKELFNGLNLIDPLTWDNWFMFTKKYCDGHYGDYGWVSDGSSNTEELRQRISKYFIRRLKEEVATDLPPKTRINIPVELSDEKQREYNIALESFREYLKNIKKKKDIQIERTLRAEQIAKLNTLREITSQGKIEFAKELIQSILDSGEKTVIFSVYNKPLELLYKEFKDVSVMITGKTSMEDRKNAIYNFQNNKKIKLFMGGLLSAGTGITLTAGSNVVFIDFSFVPADHFQAEDRVHRIGSEAEKITIYQLYAKDTIDEK